MIEVEIRARASHNEIAKRLENLHADKIKESHEHDEYFKFGRDEERRLVIRIREKAGRSILTFKGSSKLPDDVAWQEWETPAESPVALKRLLLSNGLVPVVTIDKYRKTYRYEDFEINLDIIAALGEFIEVELQAEDATLAKERIERFLTEKLGIASADFVKRGYVPLMIELQSKL